MTYQSSRWNIVLNVNLAFFKIVLVQTLILGRFRFAVERKSRTLVMFALKHDQGFFRGQITIPILPKDRGLR